ncbi:MAG: NAD(+) diphosphatase [Spirochaetia bacterium]|nr:NAD(+) diphosphatase [Spirochaetia bacterium]
MAFITNPVSSKSNCYILTEKELIVCSNGSLPSFEDTLMLRKLSPDSDFFDEKETGICAMEFEISENAVLPQGFEKKLLREYFAENDEFTGSMAARARAILTWRHETKFCGKCGGKLADSYKFSARECYVCKKNYFPRIEPCIIVVVKKDGKVLLVNHTYRNQDIYACIAGFMEAGESAENAVQREVFEETGIKIKNIKYRGSQGWPFPDQLMLGFTAEYESGELKLQKEEIADAKWFDPDNCPASPKPGSIAYKLIHGLY